MSSWNRDQDDFDLVIEDESNDVVRTTEGETTTTTADSGPAAFVEPFRPGNRGGTSVREETPQGGHALSSSHPNPAPTTQTAAPVEGSLLREEDQWDAGEKHHATPQPSLPPTTHPSTPGQAAPSVVPGSLGGVALTPHLEQIRPDGPTTKAMRRAYVAHILQLIFSGVAAATGFFSLFAIAIFFPGFVMGTLGLVYLRRLDLVRTADNCCCCRVFGVMTGLQVVTLVFSVGSTGLGTWAHTFAYEEYHYNDVKHFYRATVTLWVLGGLGVTICAILNIIFLCLLSSRVNKLVARPPEFNDEEARAVDESPEAQEARATSIRYHARRIRRLGLAVLMLGVVLIALFSGSFFVSVFSGLLCVWAGIMAMKNFWEVDELIHPPARMAPPGFCLTGLLSTTHLFLLGTVIASSVAIWIAYFRDYYYYSSNYYYYRRRYILGAYPVVSPVCLALSFLTFMVAVWLSHHVVTLRAIMFDGAGLRTYSLPTSTQMTTITAPPAPNPYPVVHVAGSTPPMHPQAGPPIQPYNMNEQPVYGASSPPVYAASSPPTYTASASPQPVYGGAPVVMSSPQPQYGAPSGYPHAQQGVTYF